MEGVQMNVKPQTYMQLMAVGWVGEVAAS